MLLECLRNMQEPSSPYVSAFLCHGKNSSLARVSLTCCRMAHLRRQRRERWQQNFSLPGKEKKRDFGRLADISMAQAELKESDAAEEGDKN